MIHELSNGVARIRRSRFRPLGKIQPSKMRRAARGVLPGKGRRRKRVNMLRRAEVIALFRRADAAGSLRPHCCRLPRWRWPRVSSRCLSGIPLAGSCWQIGMACWNSILKEILWRGVFLALFPGGLRGNRWPALRFGSR